LSDGGCWQGARPASTLLLKQCSYGRATLVRKSDNTPLDWLKPFFASVDWSGRITSNPPNNNLSEVSENED